MEATSRPEASRALDEAFSLFDSDEESQQDARDCSAKGHEDRRAEYVRYQLAQPDGENKIRQGDVKDDEASSKHALSHILQSCAEAVQKAESISLKGMKNVNADSQEYPKTWPLTNLRFHGPVCLLRNDEVGGQRAIYADCDLRPGQLAMAEAPVFEFKSSTHAKGNADGLHLLGELLESSSFKQLQGHSKSLFPCDINEVATSFKRKKLTELGGSVDVLCEKYAIHKEEAIRLLLVLQSNLFSSGLYLYLSMFNHSCDPNCAKYTVIRDGQKVSEIRCTRFVRKGEELTINYLAVAEQSRWHRRQALLTQFLFFCRCSLCSIDTPLSEALICGHGGGKSKRESNCTGITYPTRKCLKCGRTCENEKVLRLRGLEEELSAIENLGEQVGPLEKLHSVLDTMSRVVEDAHPQNIVVVRFHKLVADLSYQVLHGSLVNRNKNAVLFITSCLELLESQVALMGPLHIAVAASLKDMSNVIQLLLATDLNLLLTNFEEFGTSFDQASKIDAQLRDLHRRIKRLYEEPLP